MSPAQITCPNGCSETVGSVIGNTDGFIFIRKTNARKHRAEDFFTGNLHFARYLIENGRLYVIAVFLDLGAMTSAAQYRAFFRTALHISHNAFGLNVVNHGPHRRIRFERVLGLHCTGGLDDFIDKIIFD